jgi:hypothetical protein
MNLYLMLRDPRLVLVLGMPHTQLLAILHHIGDDGAWEELEEIVDWLTPCFAWCPDHARLQFRLRPRIHSHCLVLPPAHIEWHVALLQNLRASFERDHIA